MGLAFPFHTGNASNNGNINNTITSKPSDLIIGVEITVIVVMTEAENKVMLQVEVRESTRTRLKLQAVRLGITMGELADELLNEALNKLEQEQREGNKRTD